jgi:hypothetical protein
VERSSIRSGTHGGCRLFDGAHDAIVRTASADVSVKRLRNLGARWRLIPVEQRLG